MRDTVSEPLLQRRGRGWEPGNQATAINREKNMSLISENKNHTNTTAHLEQDTCWPNPGAAYRGAVSDRCPAAAAGSPSDRRRASRSGGSAPGRPPGGGFLLHDVSQRRSGVPKVVGLLFAGNPHPSTQAKRRWARTPGRLLDGPSEHCEHAMGVNNMKAITISGEAWVKKQREWHFFLGMLGRTNQSDKGVCQKQGT